MGAQPGIQINSGELMVIKRLNGSGKPWW